MLVAATTLSSVVADATTIEVIRLLGASKRWAVTGEPKRRSHSLFENPASLMQLADLVVLARRPHPIPFRTRP
jgi:hypothetical protein